MNLLDFVAVLSLFDCLLLLMAFVLFVFLIDWLVFLSFFIEDRLLPILKGKIVKLGICFISVLKFMTNFIFRNNQLMYSNEKQ